MSHALFCYLGGSGIRRLSDASGYLGFISTKEALMAAVLRIYADAEGESHLDEVELAFEEDDFVPPAPPVLMTPFAPADSYAFERVPPGWHGDWHPAPQRVMALYLAGEVEIAASDGDTRLLTPGTVLLAEDTSGKGHVTRVVGTEEAFVVIVALPEEA
jgi:hypothetical protein